MSESDEGLSDLDDAINSLESDEVVEVEFNDEDELVEVPEKKKVCLPCSGQKLECTYCDENNEWPAGRRCKICNGTGLRK